jgi:hypothetical protein
MSAADDLTELVERAAAAEQARSRRSGSRAPMSTRPGRSASGRRCSSATPRPPTAPRGVPEVAPPHPSDAAIDDGSPQVGFAEAASREWEAVAAVTVARLGLLEAHLAVLDARLAHSDAGEAEPEAAAVDGHVPLAGRNVMWMLLTEFAIALSQQPKIRRGLMREISDYTSNAEARAFGEEAARTASTVPQAAGASVRKPSG